MTEKPIRLWRVSYPDSGPGLSVWFDPQAERLSLRDLTEGEKLDILDSDRSVSALGQGEGAAIIDGCVPEDSRVLYQLSLFP